MLLFCTSTDYRSSRCASSFIANVPADQVLGVGTEANLRSYIAEHSERKRNGVHRAIESTMKREPDRFINRNSGMTIACSAAEIDDTKKVAKLKDASLINGAQTQGEIRRFFTEMQDGDTGEIPDDLESSTSEWKSTSIPIQRP